MKKHAKRILALVIALMTLLSVTAAFAEENGATETEKDTEWIVKDVDMEDGTHMPAGIHTSKTLGKDFSIYPQKSESTGYYYAVSTSTALFESTSEEGYTFWKLCCPATNCTGFSVEVTLIPTESGIVENNPEFWLLIFNDQDQLNGAADASALFEENTPIPLELHTQTQNIGGFFFDLTTKGGHALQPSSEMNFFFDTLDDARAYVNTLELFQEIMAGIG